MPTGQDTQGAAVARLSMDPRWVPLLFGESDIAALRRSLDLRPGPPILDFATAEAPTLAEIEVLITGWGCPALGPAELDAMPKLAAVFHAAGTVKTFLDREVWDRGILVTSAASANAIPVAEYTVAMILLAGKGVPRIAHDYARGIDKPAELSQIGNYGRTVGIVGASRIGRLVIDRLAGFDFEVLVYDPYITAEDPVLAHARSVQLDELFRRSSIVSVHAPELATTRGMIGARELQLLAPGSTIVNTARASLIDQDALIDALRTTDLTAILDVTDPEPLPVGHPLLELPGVVLTPHLAGAQGNELARLGHAVVIEAERFAAGLQPVHPLAFSDLASMA